MPQLDQVHFFSQFFWLCVFYFGFYFFIVKHFLPRMARILQFRKNKLGGDAQENVSHELGRVQDSGRTALENIINTSHKFWSQNSQTRQEWWKSKVHALNNEFLKHLYIKRVGDYSLAQNAALGGITLSTQSATFVWFLADRLKKTQKNNMTHGDLHKMITPSHYKPTNKKLTRDLHQASSPAPTSAHPQPTLTNAHKKGKKGKKQ